MLGSYFAAYYFRAERVDIVGSRDIFVIYRSEWERGVFWPAARLEGISRRIDVRIVVDEDG